MAARMATRMATRMAARARSSTKKLDIQYNLPSITSSISTHINADSDFILDQWKLLDHWKFCLGGGAAAEAVGGVVFSSCETNRC